jgi:hypothetical protein
MPLYIMYLNLKDGVSEDEFVKKLKASFDYNTGKVEGFGLGKLYRHHLFGANPRTYQIHVEFKDLGTWDRFMALIEKDAQAERLFHEWQSLVEMKTHYDEFIRELPF